MESCCICLDPPQPDNSLHLISCGCQGAWFHEKCNDMWLFRQDIPRCPICRRDVPIQLNHDFSHPILRLMKFLYIVELFLYYYTTPVIQGTAILAFPFIFPCSQDFIFFASHYSIHSMLDMVFIPENDIIFFRYLHLILLTMYINNKKIYPLTQFVIGRSIIYAKTLEYSEPVNSSEVSSASAPFAAGSAAFALTASQSATNATEGNKPRRRRR